MTARRGRVLLPSLAAGVLLALSLPPFGWWPLALLGAGLAFWRLGGLGWRTRLWSGWAIGLGCYAVGLGWARTFNWYGAVVLVAAEAASMAVAALLVPPVHGRLPCFVGAFTLLESLRMRWPFGGLPMGGVFLGQADGPLLQAARLGGPLLLTALVWAAGAGGSLVLRAVWRHGAGSVAGSGTGDRGPAPGRPGAVGALTGVGALVVTACVAGAAAHAPDGGAALRTIRVAAVQGGGPGGTDRAQVDPARVLAAQVQVSRRLTRRGPGAPRLVLWPEDVISVIGPLAGTPQSEIPGRLARRLGATVLAGATVTVSDTRFRNEVVAWGPGGRVVGTYEKVHRVPFGEYVPLRGLFSHLADLSAVPLDAVPGRGSGLLRTPAGPVGVLVSYEVFFADRGRSAVRAGAQLLVVPTNTSSYGTAQVPGQEVAADEVQAVEQGRDLVQAAPTGYSTVVDDRGRLRRRSTLGAPQVVLAPVALRSGRTVYADLGDTPLLVASAVLLTAGWLHARRRSRRPGRGAEADPVAPRSAAPVPDLAGHS